MIEPKNHLILALDVIGLERAAKVAQALSLIHISEPTRPY